MPEKMKRTQIYLEPELDEDLSRLAARRGVSKAQLLQEGAYRIVREERAAEEDSILGVIGLGDSEPGRVSEEHDQFLGQLKLDRAT
ncbi:MAG: CopG family transcriptional regulator [Dehalococcoidia bacterium]|nr:CopG family transcriptional regulator [Dehalococcoidia bacterium]